ncbi:unnamed protein product [Prorocentrum cordatum]|nr:unnamed protein product [Polarella glacialis]
MLEELRGECVAGDLGVDEAYGVHIQLIIRAGCSEFLWEPGPEVKLQHEDRVYYDHAHVCNQDRRGRRHGSHDIEPMRRRLAEFERILTDGAKDRVYEEDFEFVEMTARAENGTAEGVPVFLEHSVTGDVEHAQRLFEQQRRERGWTQRPKALNLEHLFKTRLAGYRRQGTREIVWGPGPDLYWERGDRPLRLFRVAQEPVRVRFHRHEEPYGFHLQDLSGGGGGAEVIEVVEGSPADARGIVVGRTVKRLCTADSREDVRHWSRAQIEAALAQMPDCFVVEFGKGDTEERRHAPLGDAEMAILMDERFMRGFLHELGHVCEDAPAAGAPGGVGQFFDPEGWNAAFPGLVAAPRGPSEAAVHAPAAEAKQPGPAPAEASPQLMFQHILPPPGAPGAPPPSSWPLQPHSPAAGSAPAPWTPARAAPARSGSPMRVALTPDPGGGRSGVLWASPDGARPSEVGWPQGRHSTACQEAAGAAKVKPSPSPRRDAAPPPRLSPAGLDHQQDPPLKVQIGRHSQPQGAVGQQSPQQHPQQHRAGPRAWTSFPGWAPGAGSADGAV